MATDKRKKIEADIKAQDAKSIEGQGLIEKGRAMQNEASRKRHELELSLNALDREDAAKAAEIAANMNGQQKTV